MTAPRTRVATDLAQGAHFGLWPAPWTVRSHPEQTGHQHPFLWSCTVAACDTGGRGVNELDAHGDAADHYIRVHDSH